MRDTAAQTERKNRSDQPQSRYHRNVVQLWRYAAPSAPVGDAVKLTLALVLVLSVSACSSDDSTNDTMPVQKDQGSSSLAPEGATAVETEVGTVYVADDTVYAEDCDALEPYTSAGTLHELVGMEPPDGLADFGYICQ